jgi:hypothetical protein
MRRDRLNIAGIEVHSGKLDLRIASLVDRHSDSETADYDSMDIHHNSIKFGTEVAVDRIHLSRKIAGFAVMA